MKFLNFGVPTDLLTVAPAPSAWLVASKTCWMPRFFGSEAFREGSSGGMTGKPTKVDEGPMAEKVRVELLLNRRVLVMELNVLDRRNGRMYSRSGSRWMKTMARMITKREKTVRIGGDGSFYSRSRETGTVERVLEECDKWYCTCPVATLTSTCVLL